MDFCRNVSFPGDYQQDQVLSPPCSKLDDLFSPQNTEVDVSLEWLSVFVEDCLSSKGNCLPAAAPPPAPPPTSVQNTRTATLANPTKPLELPQLQPHQTPTSLHKISVPCKTRSKRRRASTTPKTKVNPSTTWSWTKHLNPHNQTLQLGSSDPPLLQQEYWLADSELILPKKEHKDDMKGDSEEEEAKVVMVREGLVGSLEVGSGQQPRRCSHCLAQKTPQWRAGPLGPKTLCNACGVRYKSGRLLPEYRPAKSPTFVSYLHSNSHKKVLEMRMALLSSIPSQQ
ncbi:hypothetical protein SLEP1_g60044 [Rubroshorea leprosula]|uniref:GATA-type domain-containing protein n=1 Tax=Rubroshorea leprosula TaxID=152421 RepID=A0AAV5MVP2_9ROSI|nr:hypothetical protein SLEP1_g60044 [Rubroshorea leprosula]